MTSYIHKKDRATELILEAKSHLQESHELLEDISDEITDEEMIGMDKVESVIAKLEVVEGIFELSVESED